MTAKKDTAGRGGRVDRQPKAVDRDDGQSTGRGQRLREARETMDLTRKKVADALQWSESRLISYETEATQPNASEIEQLAAMYGRDRAWLAFGDAYEMGSGARAAGPLGGVWLPKLGGGELPVPASLVAGVLGPLKCAVAGDRAGLGLSSGDVLVVQVKAAPTPNALWVVSEAGSIRIGWIAGITRSTAQVRFDLAGGSVPVGISQLVGRVVATMQRVLTPDASGASPRDGRGRR